MKGKCEARHPYYPSVRCQKPRGHPDLSHRFMSWDAKRTIQWRLSP